MSVGTAQVGVTSHSALGTAAWPGSGSAGTRCVSWMAGSAMVSMTVATPQTRKPVVSPPPLPPAAHLPSLSFKGEGCTVWAAFGI